MASEVLLYRIVSFKELPDALRILRKIFRSRAIIQIKEHLSSLVSRLQDRPSLRCRRHCDLFGAHRLQCPVILCSLSALLLRHAVYGCACTVSVHNSQVITSVIGAEPCQPAISLKPDRCTV